MEVFRDFTGLNGAGQLWARYGHILAGASWLGLLYYYNFVQVVAFPALSVESRADTIREITSRVVNWTRWSSLVTVLTGVLILYFQEPFATDGGYTRYFATTQGTAIAFGMILGTVMLVVVWTVIHPNQKLVQESAEAAALGRSPSAEASVATKKLARASRCNALLSIPMLWFMVVSPHFAGGSFRFSTEPGANLVSSTWALFIASVGFVTLSALGFMGGLDSRTNKVLFDDPRRTVAGGVLLWILLWFVGFELILGSAQT